jgi:hypothetical protein
MVIDGIAIVPVPQEKKGQVVMKTPSMEVNRE